jgi:hypothetical protein
VEKQKLKATILCMAVLVLLCFQVLIPAFAAGEGEVEIKKSSGFNIVFVVDTSLSLRTTRGEGTDPGGLRYDALGQILSWLPGTKSRVGIITFNRNASQYDPKLRLMESMDDVVELRDYVANKKLGEWTNITEAMEQALEFFPNLDASNVQAEREKRGLDENLPNLIMLFTDGVIDLPGGRSAVSESAGRLTSLAKEAKNREVEIATVALNTNGEAQSEELKKISELSGSSLFQEVRSAAGLKEAFDAIHDFLFSSQKFDLVAGESKRFQVPRIGALALTITLSPDDAIELTSPVSKRVYTMDDAEMLDDDHMVIQIPQPEGGSWKYKLSGEDGGGVIPTNPDLSFSERLYNTISSPPLAGALNGASDALVSTLLGKKLKKELSKKGVVAVCVLGVVLVFTAIFCGIFNFLSPGYL